MLPGTAGGITSGGIEIRGRLSGRRAADETPYRAVRVGCHRSFPLHHRSRGNRIGSPHPGETAREGEGGTEAGAPWASGTIGRRDQGTISVTPNKLGLRGAASAVRTAAKKRVGAVSGEERQATGVGHGVERRRLEPIGRRVRVWSRRGRESYGPPGCGGVRSDHGGISQIGRGGAAGDAAAACRPRPAAEPGSDVEPG